MAVKRAPYLNPITIQVGATLEYEFEIRLDNVPVDPTDIAEITISAETKYDHETGATALFEGTKTGGEITVTESSGDTIARIEIADTVISAITYSDLNYGKGLFKIIVEFTDGVKRVYAYGELHFIGLVVGA